MPPIEPGEQPTMRISGTSKLDSIFQPTGTKLNRSNRFGNRLENPELFIPDTVFGYYGFLLYDFLIRVPFLFNLAVFILFVFLSPFLVLYYGKFGTVSEINITVLFFVLSLLSVLFTHYFLQTLELKVFRVIGQKNEGYRKT